MTTVFVTGGLGFIGYHLCSQLVAQGHDVAIYDACRSYLPAAGEAAERQFAYRRYMLGDRVRLTTGDIQDFSRLAAALADAQPQVIVHLAAIPLPAVCNADPVRAAQVNATGTVVLMSAARTVPTIRRIVFVSSSYVLGDFQHEPADEEHPTVPLDTYGATKLAGEVLVSGLARSFGLEFVLVRPSAVYGPTDANRRVVQIFVENALASQPLIARNGDNRLDFTYCEDLARGLVLAALHSNAANAVFHMTYGEAHSLTELADIVAQVVPGTCIVQESAHSQAPKRGTLSIAKAQSLLGYRPLVPLEEGVARYVTFIRSQSQTH